MADVSRDGSYLTPGQAARILGVSPKTVNRWADLDRIPCEVTLGGHRRFRADVITAVSASTGINNNHQPGEPS